MGYEFKKLAELPVIEELPDVLEGVAEAGDWPARREYIKALLSHYMLGHRPENDRGVVGTEKFSYSEIYEGRAVREDVRLYIGNDEYFDIYVVRPNREGVFPAVVWTFFPFAKECPAGEYLVDNGIVLAAFDYNGLMKDDPKGPESSAMRAYPEADWKAIQIWGWGFSKVADYLTSLPYIDRDRLMCTGHSRNGKAALAAGAFDERFSVVAPINSGCGGAGCFRFLCDDTKIIQDPKVTESCGRITHAFPHWFADELMTFGGQEDPYPVTNENRLPFDLHFLKALVAPRALITVEAFDDLWSNVYGSYLTRVAAQKAFELLGAPENNFQIIREGGHRHDETAWKLSIEFARRTGWK